MKTNQLILAVAALTVFAACSKQDAEFLGKTSENEIGFNAVNRKATKANNAIINGTTYATDNTFQVWGWQSQNGTFSEFAEDAASNFMSNLTISYCGGPQSRDDAWRNSAHYYYWPFTGEIAFLAVHPSTVAPTTQNWDATNKFGKATFADYTIAAGNKTTDLMLASAKSARRADALPLVFNHALSQIEVKVKTDQDYTADVVFDVESVQFNNIDLSGDLAYANTGTFFTWTDNAAQTEDWDYYTTKLANINNVEQVYGAANVMIPQAANAKDPSDDDDLYTDHTTLTISYSMTQAGSAKITGTVVMAAPQEWIAGKKYIYHINFRLNEILFDPEVVDWAVVNVETINIY